MFGPPNLDELTYFVGKFARTKVTLIPNSIPHVLRSVPQKEKRLLWLGRLENSQKRVDLIVPLWKVLSNALPDWHLDIVGDGPARSDLEKAIAKSGLQRVTIHGRQVPNLYYQRSPIYIMTSAWEGFPNTVVEAQSFGAVAVLFDSFPIAKWMISDGEDGFLVKPLDTEAMARTVIDLVSRDDLSTHMELALENAQRFHIDRVGKMWEELFDSLVQAEGADSEHENGRRALSG
jgi:glycosyltransferase involved in cell wall biosynthesis